MKTAARSEMDNFELLFKEHYPFLCLVSFSVLKDRDAAKDVVQDFFISYWQKRSSITIKSSFQAYAGKAVKNLSLQALKHTIKERTFLDGLNLPTSETQKSTDKEKGHGNIYEALNKLPAKRREIFISSVMQGHSYSEIAEANGISINTVKTQIKRSYSFLRSHIKEDILYLSAFISQYFV
ncbi:MAG: RNA polymerase sigma-70 factor [Sediminicola sp.]